MVSGQTPGKISPGHNPQAKKTPDKKPQAKTP